MKTVIALILTALLFSACEKDCKSMMVIRDCTGTYLRDGGKDYHVCNATDLAKYNDGETVEAQYHPVLTCSVDEVVCMLYHPNEGWIVVDSVK